MNYKEFLSHIFERYSGNVKLGLERIYFILKEMDNPEKKINGIHVAGTNGKGSTSAINESLFIHHGLSVGMNTSPHLMDYCERFRINGKNVFYTEILEVYLEYSEIFDKYDASFFEITTAIAFALFHKKNLDVTVMEVGLGGRLDGTEPFNATVSVITTISLDHPKSLGDSIEKIAFEKAGIIKTGVPVVLGNIVEEAKNVILKVAEQKKSPVFEYKKDFFVENISVTKDGTIFDFSFPNKGIEFKQLCVNLIGDHQAINASIAITDFILYCEIFEHKINENSIRKSLMKVNWFGRMQILKHKPLVIIDGAHNEEGVHALISNLNKMFPNTFKRFVVAILRDKKLDNMIAEICQNAQEIYISKNHSERAADLEEQMLVAKKFLIPSFSSNDVVTATLEALKKTKDDEILIITGSLYTIAEVLCKKDEIFNG